MRFVLLTTAEEISFQIEVELRSERRAANGGAVDEIEDHIEGRYLCALEAVKLPHS